MNLRSLNSSSMQGASFDREIASGFARKAISQDGEAVRSDSSAVAVDDAQVARTTSAPVVLRVGDSRVGGGGIVRSEEISVQSVSSIVREN